ncbi:MAG: HAMP domain-containing sensor histidine kinase, partial [Acidobacteriota bacterium]
FVADNGRGIPAQQQSRVFDLFSKLDGGTDGTGIGLAIVHRIITGHGGRIWVESGGAGLGTRFCFTLPVAEPPAGDDAASAPGGDE